MTKIKAEKTKKLNALSSDSVLEKFLIAKIHRLRSSLKNALLDDKIIVLPQVTPLEPVIYAGFFG